VAFRLIPREERFFDDFVALAEQMRKGAALLEEMLAPTKPIWDKADEIKEVEHKCDHITHEVIQRLHRTFVTPLDREDIHTLARTLDDVMDAIDASASVVRLYQIEVVRPDEADRVHENALRRLFEEERDPIAIIKWKEILDFLEVATDRCEDVANVLEGIVVKHA
jgi:uncharacterized protein Yka (UPF0111/DUF47 family)